MPSLLLLLLLTLTVFVTETLCLYDVDLDEELLLLLLIFGRILLCNFDLMRPPAAEIRTRDLRGGCLRRWFSPSASWLELGVEMVVEVEELVGAEVVIGVVMGVVMGVAVVLLEEVPKGVVEAGVTLQEKVVRGARGDRVRDWRMEEKDVCG